MKNRVLWLFWQYKSYFAWPAVIALVILAAAPMAYSRYYQPLAQTVNGLEDDVLDLNRVIRANKLSPPKPVKPIAWQHAKDFPSTLAKLIALAGTQRIDLQSGDYQVQRETDGKLARFTLTFPMNTNYLNLRHFMEQARAQTPGLRIENVQIDRERIEIPQLKVQLRLSLLTLEDGQ